MCMSQGNKRIHNGLVIQDKMIDNGTWRHPSNFFQLQNGERIDSNIDFKDLSDEGLVWKRCGVVLMVKHGVQTLH